MQNEKIHTTLKPAIGESDFKSIIGSEQSTGKKNALYVDKTLMIRDIIDDPAKFFLFTRPRRFGKTLNMSMLKHFFHEKSDIFNNLKIATCPNIIENFQGSRPTISITLKDVVGRTYADMLEKIVSVIKHLYRQNKDILDDYGNKFLEKEIGSIPEIEGSLRHLSELLSEKNGKKVLILIDEYDTPLNNAYSKGYLKEALELFRNFFSEALKDNPYLYKGIITGINRIAKESLFSGLNALNIYGINRKKYSEYFGFTEEEIESLYLPTQNKAEIKKWYNGYNFGGTTIYNPWSILKYIENDFIIDTYWSNSGNTELIEDNFTPEVTAKIDKLLNNDSIAVENQDSTIYTELKTNSDAFFNLLYNAGYLTNSESIVKKEYSSTVQLRIVNKELNIEMRRVFARWLTNKRGGTYLPELIDDFVSGNVNNLQEKLSEIALRIFSFHDLREDYQESFYHGFILGISIGAQDRFTIKSNRESGYGRYDIAWYPNHESGSKIKDPGVVIELKVDKSSAEEALSQINVKHYETDLIQHGCDKILKYGIHFNGKKLKIVKA